MRKLLIFILLWPMCQAAFAQAPSGVKILPVAPSTCTAGDQYWNSTNAKLYNCTSTNTWTAVPATASSYLTFGNKVMPTSVTAPTANQCLAADSAASSIIGTTCGGGGSMTWPSGSAGIPNYSGSSSWGTTYNSGSQIPADFLAPAATSTQTTGPVTMTCTSGAYTSNGSSLTFNMPSTVCADGTFLSVTNEASTPVTMSLQGGLNFLGSTTVNPVLPGNSFGFYSDGTNWQGTQPSAIQNVATASEVDYFTAAGSATGNPATVTITAAGSDSNINLNLVSKGTGTVQCNGAACGGGSGTVNSGTANQLAYYSATGTAVSGDSNVTDSGTSLQAYGLNVTSNRLNLPSTLQWGGGLSGFIIGSKQMYVQGGIYGGISYPIILSPGITTSGAQAGVVIQGSYFQTGTIAVGDVLAMTSTNQTLQDAPLGATNLIGIATSTSTSGGQLVNLGGATTVNFDATTVTAGDHACGPPASTGTAGKAHDNGATKCPSGEELGIITIGGSASTGTVLLHVGS